jgi:glycosyltransferase involved in cell wall biosynthesis
MSERITVIIPCKNEILNIRHCIDSVAAFADEILVADSGSTDGTLEYAREREDCRVIEREYIHSGDFKNWAIPQAKNPWVLIVDADERVDPALAAEIRAAVQDPNIDGYWLRRANHFMGRRIRFSGWNSDRVLRLFRRDLGHYVGDTDHAEVEVTGGQVETLQNRLTHYTYTTYSQFLQKLDRYSDVQSTRWRDAGKRPNFLKLLFNGPLRFVLTYIVRGGFRDGWAGFQLCVLTGFGSFMKQARLWEKWQVRA